MYCLLFSHSLVKCACRRHTHPQVPIVPTLKMGQNDKYTDNVRQCSNIFRTQWCRGIIFGAKDIRVFVPFLYILSSLIHFFFFVLSRSFVICRVPVCVYEYRWHFRDYPSHLLMQSVRFCFHRSDLLRDEHALCLFRRWIIFHSFHPKRKR